LSTSAILADRAPSWKQEVNRRVAAHQGRKASSAAETKPRLESNPGANRRAAEAAARVAARYAKAPSYSEMLASEARAAVRAAEAASRAALEAQAAAESVLAGLEASTLAERPWEPETVEGGTSGQTCEPSWEAILEPMQLTAPKSSQAAKKQSFGILWDADMPVRAAFEATRATHGPGFFESSAEGWRQSARLARDEQDSFLESEAIEVVEPAQPIPARLIEFPRQLVATRKVRPRLAEGPHARVGNAVGQLSIFEVDPATISTQPAAVAEAASAWPGTDWSSIRLGEQMQGEQSPDELPAEEAEATTAPAAAFELAPVSRRLMAAIVDSSLIAGVFLALAMAVLNKAKELPNLRQAELGAALTLAVLAMLYHVFFLLLAAKTPGMKWACLSLRTFGGQKLTLDERCGRLGALVLSLLPVGLGVAWAIFDDEHLSWHDRLSGTYVRMG
jgi:uncharacterized RDD family membrane protein YckC